jgi:hypothetical protein
MLESRLQYEARWFVREMQNVESLKFVNVPKSWIFPHNVTLREEVLALKYDFYCLFIIIIIVY